LHFWDRTHKKSEGHEGKFYRRKGRNDNDGKRGGFLGAGLKKYDRGGINLISSSGGLRELLGGEMFFRFMKEPGKLHL